MSLPRTVALLALLSACAGRTSPATQPTPVAFDPATSDAKAIAAVDAMTAAIGGTAAWEEVKQLSWEQTYTRDGKLVGSFRHYWDRWNGRHRFEKLDLASVAKAEAEGRPDDAAATVAMYDLFDHDGKGYASFDNNPLDKASKDDFIGRAYEAWKSDSYRLAVIHKLKDPGVILNLEEVREDVKGKCVPSCTVVKVTFVPEVGTDTWYVSINDSSKMPDILERDVEAGRLGFALGGWTEIRGLKFPTEFSNLGLSEIFAMKNLAIGDPDDALYIPRVR